MSINHNFVIINDHDEVFTNRGLFAGMKMSDVLKKLTKYATILESDPTSYISSEEEENDQNTD